MSEGTSELSLPQGASTTPFGALLRQDVWRALPIWFYLFYGVLLFNTALTNLSPPQPVLAWGAVAPLAAFVFIQALRARAASSASERFALIVGSAAPAILLPLFILAVHRPSPLSGHGLLVAYEVSNFFWAGLLFWHAFHARPAHASLFFGAGLFYGALLENGGILLGFFHETNLKITVVPPLVAPLATMLGWCVVLYMGTFVVWQLRESLPWLRGSPALSGLLVAVFATLLDVQIDPLATAAGAWVWHHSLPPWFLGVPRVNFVAWICALFPFAWALFRHQERAGIADGGAWTSRDVWTMTRASPLILAGSAVCFLTAITLLEGVHGPSWQILFDAGTRALGLVSVRL